MATNSNNSPPRMHHSYSSDDDYASAGKKSRTKNRPFVYVLTGLSAIGGFLFGYDTGVVSGAMLLIRVEFRLLNDPVWQELIVSVTIAAAWAFALIGGYLVDAFGRKPVILVASFVFGAGAVIMAASNTKELLLVGRLVVGVGIGLASMSVPIYLAEISSPNIRGRLVTVNQVCITGGQFVASIVCGLFSSDQENGWRFMLGLSGVPAVIQFVGFLGMPETPRWLVKTGQRERAADVLRSIRGADVDVDIEVEAIRRSCEEADEEIQGRSVIIEILRTPSVRRALVVGCALQMFQQLAGINTVMYYSATIFQMAGISSTSLAVWMSAVTAACNFISSFFGLYLVQKMRRRSQQASSMLGVIAGLVVIGIGFQLAATNSPATTFSEQSALARNDTCATFSSCTPCTNDANCGFCYETMDGNVFNGSCISVFDTVDVDSSAYGRCTNTSGDGNIAHLGSTEATWSHAFCPTPTVYKAVLIFGMCFYILCFESGMGPMPWIINSEIYPLWARGTCFAVSTSFNWLFNVIVAMTFLTLTDAITKYGAFYLYAGITLVGMLFLFMSQQESRGKSLEEIEGLFAGPLFSGGRIRGGGAGGGGGGGILPAAITSDRTVQKLPLEELNGTK